MNRNLTSTDSVPRNKYTLSTIVKKSFWRGKQGDRYLLCHTLDTFPFEVFGLRRPTIVTKGTRITLPRVNWTRGTRLICVLREISGRYLKVILVK